MSKNLIPNFDKKLKPTKTQLKILENIKICRKITDYLELETKGTTTRNYAQYIRDYFVKLNITHINNYFQDPRILENNKKIFYLDNIEKDIKIFNKKLEHRSGSYRKANLSAVRELLESNKIDLGNHFWKKIRKNGKKAVRQTEIETPTKHQLEKILSNADIESKAFFITQMSSGSRLSEIRTLTFDRLHLDRTPPQIRVIQEHSKNDEPITKFISSESKELIEDYITNHRKRILKTRKNRTITIKTKQNYQNMVFPISESTIETKWNNLLNKVNLHKIDPKTKHSIMGTHSLRRYFEDNIGHRKLAKYLTNKLSKSQEPYQYKTKNKLEDEYLEYEKNLYVFKLNSEIEEDVTEIKQELEKTKGKLKIAKDRLGTFEKKSLEYETKLNNLDNKLESYINPYKPEFKENIEEITKSETFKRILPKNIEKNLTKNGTNYLTIILKKYRKESHNKNISLEDLIKQKDKSGKLVKDFLKIMKQK